MSLASNQTLQMAERLAQDLKKLLPALTVSSSQDANNNSVLTVSSGSSPVAIVGLARRQFEGFNITLELSASAGNGYAEHICTLAVNSDIALEQFAMIFKAAQGASASQFNLNKMPVASSHPLVAADLDGANTTQIIPNNARLGFVGA